MSLTEIIEGCVRRDSICQKLLYDKYKDAMFTLCVRLSGCDIEAQDIFQEGFIDVFSSISAFRNEATIGAWMKIIFTRKAYKSYRKKLWVEDIDALEENELVDWRNEINTEHCSKYFYDVFVDYRKNNARTSQFRNNTGLQFGARFGIDFFPIYFSDYQSYE
ncbi:MAG: hypothetical protein ACI9V1_002831 [Spirosomataceae bacterium]